MGQRDKVVFLAGKGKSLEVGASAPAKRGCWFAPKMVRATRSTKQRQSDPVPAQRGRWLNFAGPLLLFLLVVFLYLPSIGNDFIYDDTQVILAQPAPRSFADVAKIFAERHFPRLPYYRPLTRTSLLVQKSLHGDNPAPFHLVNVALMGVAGVLAYSLLRLPPFAIRPLPAFLAAALFSFHPVASSCVYPISSGRETLLPSVWTLLAVHAYLRGGSRWRWVAFLAFVGGLLSKEQAVIIPALFLLADVLKLSKDSPASGAAGWVHRYWPFAPVLLGYFLLRHVLFGSTQYAPGILFGPFVSAIYALQSIVTPFKGLVYEPTIPVWFSLPRLVITGSIVTLLVVFSIGQRATLGRQAAFWTGWFVITLLPTANLLQQEAAFDERYVFLPSLSLISVVALLASANWQQVIVSRGTIAGNVIFIVWAGLISVGRCDAFKDDVRFSEQWLRTNPGIGSAVEDRQSSLDLLGRFHERWFSPSAAAVNAHYNLAFALAKRGRFEASIVHYSEALRLNPDYAYAHNNLGNALAAVGRQEEALAHFLRATRLDPDYVDAHYNFGLALARLGKLDEAAAQFLKALKLISDPSEAQPSLDYAAIHNNLGNVLAQQGKLAEAMAHYSEALRLRADYAEAHNNLANLLVSLNRFEEAVRHYSEALRFQPDYADARHNLDIVLSRVHEEAR